MKQNEKEIPLSDLEIARIVGGTRKMVLRYKLGDDALPAEVSQRLDNLFRTWQQVCTGKKGTIPIIPRPSPERYEKMRRQLETTIKRGEWEMLKAELALEKIQEELEIAQPMLNYIQLLQAKDQFDMGGSAMLNKLNYRLVCMLEHNDPVQQLMIRYRLELGWNQLHTARHLLGELELLRKEEAAAKKGTSTKAAGHQIKRSRPAGRKTNGRS